jgi:hypothetical protein
MSTSVDYAAVGVSRMSISNSQVDAINGMMMMNEGKFSAKTAMKAYSEVLNPIRFSAERS